MENYVLDTNFFFNLQEIKNFGKTTQEVIENLTGYIKKLHILKKAFFYIPYSVAEELKTFFDQPASYFDEFLSLIYIKAPDRNLTTIPGQVFFDFVKETRQRTYRGLKIAEEEVRKAAKLFLKETSLDKIEFEKKVGEVIKTLRNRYRNATRSKTIDSKADVDLLLLSLELKAFLISTDEGVLLWAEKLGIKTIPAYLFKNRLDNLLKD